MLSFKRSASLDRFFDVDNIEVIVLLHFTVVGLIDSGSDVFGLMMGFTVLLSSDIFIKHLLLGSPCPVDWLSVSILFSSKGIDIVAVFVSFRFSELTAFVCISLEAADDCTDVDDVDSKDIASVNCG